MSNNLNVPEARDPERRARQAKQIAIERRLLLTLAPVAQLLIGSQQQQLVQSRRDRLESLHDRIQPLQEMSRQNPESIAVQLKSRDLEVRLAALRLVLLHRPHLEAELIALLNDKERLVRQSAHESLVRLARGTDFGPRPNADRAERLQAMRSWKTWLALQDAPKDAVLAKGNERAKPDGVQARAPADQRAASKPVALRSAEAEADRLTHEFLKAPAEQKEQILAQFKDGKGDVHTQALAAAIPQLNKEWQSKARDVLAERLARMTAATLRNYLGDDDPEIRRAAALACALQNSRQHFPELLVLLDDSELIVADAAHTALKRLTKEDLGPKADASDSQRLQAIAAWYAWWKKTRDKLTQAP